VSTFKPLLDAYIGSFKDKVSFWTGFLLLVRVIAPKLSTFYRDDSFLATTFLLGGLLCIQGYTHPFKSKINIQEYIGNAVVQLHMASPIH